MAQAVHARLTEALALEEQSLAARERMEREAAQLRATAEAEAKRSKLEAQRVRLEAVQSEREVEAASLQAVEHTHQSAGQPAPQDALSQLEGAAELSADSQHPRMRRLRLMSGSAPPSHHNLASPRLSPRQSPRLMPQQSPRHGSRATSGGVSL